VQAVGEVADRPDDQGVDEAAHLVGVNLISSVSVGRQPSEHCRSLGESPHTPRGEGD
jgi:hypothetical protein